MRASRERAMGSVVWVPPPCLQAASYPTHNLCRQPCRIAHRPTCTHKNISQTVKYTHTPQKMISLTHRHNHISNTKDHTITTQKHKWISHIITHIITHTHNISLSLSITRTDIHKHTHAQSHTVREQKTQTAEYCDVNR